MLTRESSAQVTPASVRLLNVNGVPYFWPLRLSRRAGGASVGGEARYAAALLPAATCCGCGAGAGASAARRSAAAIRGTALTMAPTRISISRWFRTMGGGYRRMWRGAQLAHRRGRRSRVPGAGPRRRAPAGDRLAGPEEAREGPVVDAAEHLELRFHTASPPTDEDAA